MVWSRRIKSRMKSTESVQRQLKAKPQVSHRDASKMVFKQEDGRRVSLSHYLIKDIRQSNYWGKAEVKINEMVSLPHHKRLRVLYARHMLTKTRLWLRINSFR